MDLLAESIEFLKYARECKIRYTKTHVAQPYIISGYCTLPKVRRYFNTRKPKLIIPIISIISIIRVINYFEIVKL